MSSKYIGKCRCGAKLTNNSYTTHDCPYTQMNGQVVNLIPLTEEDDKGDVIRKWADRLAEVAVDVLFGGVQFTASNPVAQAHADAVNMLTRFCLREKVAEKMYSELQATRDALRESE